MKINGDEFDGHEVDLKIGDLTVKVHDVVYSDNLASDYSRFFTLNKAPRYPGEGNRLTRRTAAKGKVRK